MVASTVVVLLLVTSSSVSADKNSSAVDCSDFPFPKDTAWTPVVSRFVSAEMPARAWWRPRGGAPLARFRVDEAALMSYLDEEVKGFGACLEEGGWTGRRKLRRITGELRVVPEGTTVPASLHFWNYPSSMGGSFRVAPCGVYTYALRYGRRTLSQEGFTLPTTLAAPRAAVRTGATWAEISFNSTMTWCRPGERPLLCYTLKLAQQVQLAIFSPQDFQDLSWLVAGGRRPPSWKTDG